MRTVDGRAGARAGEPEHIQPAHIGMSLCRRSLCCVGAMFRKKDPAFRLRTAEVAILQPPCMCRRFGMIGGSSGGRHDWQPVVAARPAAAPLIFSLSSRCRSPADGVTGVVAGVAMTGTTWRSLRGRWRCRSSSLRRWCPCDPCSARRLHYSYTRNSNWVARVPRIVHIVLRWLRELSLFFVLYMVLASRLWCPSFASSTHMLQIKTSAV
jgi:hypothetical protein